MQPIEIIVIIVAALIVIAVFGNMIYRRIKKMPANECSCCKARMNRAMKRMKKEQRKK